MPDKTFSDITDVHRETRESESFGLTGFLKKAARRVLNDKEDPLFISSNDVKTNPTITIVNVPLKEIKKSFTFLEGTKKFFIKSEKAIKIMYNYNEVDFDANKKATITDGGFLVEDRLNLPSGVKIFFETDKDNVDIEFTQWT